MLPSKSGIMYEHNMEPECKTNNTGESRLKKYIYIGVYERERKSIVDMRKIGYTRKISKLFDSILSVSGVDMSMLFSRDNPLSSSTAAFTKIEYMLEPYKSKRGESVK